jgi:hypothetical protein
MSRYPTKPSDRKTSANGISKKQSSGRKKSRTSQPVPEIYVRIIGPGMYPVMARAYLRNNKGYLLLQWRDGERVRSYYLGKARKSSPTAAAPTPDQVRTSSPAPAARARRIKTRGRNG